jgi:SAM-dependent methyltransferase
MPSEVAAAYYLDAILCRWRATPAQRAAWRALVERLERLGTHEAALHSAALMPGLLQARLGAALTLAGYDRSALQGARVLTLGAHVGLEVRMLRDWGADAVGVERAASLVRWGEGAGVTAPGTLIVADAASFLRQSRAAWDLILTLAPSDPAWTTWPETAAAALRPGGRFVAVAYWRDIPVAWYDRLVPCVEGTMAGGRWRPDGAGGVLLDLEVSETPSKEGDEGSWSGT